MSLKWSVDELSPLVDLLRDVIPGLEEIINTAERGGCKSKGDIPRRDTAREQWQEAIRHAINEGYLERLMQEIQSQMTGDSEEEFRQRLQAVAARRLIGLLGGDYAKLIKAIEKLLEEEEWEKQLNAAAAIRKIALRLWKELNSDISWQALTPVETSPDEINMRREVLITLCVNIIGASDYMRSVAKPLTTPGIPSDPQEARMYLAAPGRTQSHSLDNDDKLRRMVDARMTLVTEASRLWSTLREKVTLAPREA